MGTLEVIFLIFFSSSSILSAAQNDCNPSVCSHNQPLIKFPFHQEDPQPKRCGYPGFNVKCSNVGETVLRLPFSGEFVVRDINYFTQEVHLYDPDNCLPKRILNLNLSGSPFKVDEFSQNFTFLNCTMRSLFTPISCLSSSSHTVYAVYTFMFDASLLNSCKLITTALMPIPRPPQFGYGPSADINNDLRLVWRRPYCTGCESRGGVCRFRNQTSLTLEAGCFDLPSTGKESTSDHANLPKGLVLGLGIPVLIITVIAITYLCIRVTARYQRPQSSPTPGLIAVLPQPPILNIGMDRATIESYPKVVLGESRRHPGPDDNTCSICLAEYHPNDTLRCIPECQHCFHADCVDKWLRLNASCPVCRNSPTKQTSVV